MKNWELCPKCNGSGQIQGFELSTSDKCNLCNGRMVINSLTGLPPNGSSVRSTIIAVGDSITTHVGCEPPFKIKSETN